MILKREKTPNIQENRIRSRNPHERQITIRIQILRSSHQSTVERKATNRLQSSLYL